MLVCQEREHPLGLAVAIRKEDAGARGVCIDPQHDLPRSAFGQFHRGPDRLRILRRDEFHAAIDPLAKASAQADRHLPGLLRDHERFSLRRRRRPPVERQRIGLRHRDLAKHAAPLAVDLARRLRHRHLDDPHVATGEGEQAVVMPQFDDRRRLRIGAGHPPLVPRGEHPAGGHRLGARAARRIAAPGTGRTVGIERNALRARPGMDSQRRKILQHQPQARARVERRPQADETVEFSMRHVRDRLHAEFAGCFRLARHRFHGLEPELEHVGCRRRAVGHHPSKDRGRRGGQVGQRTEIRGPRIIDRRL